MGEFCNQNFSKAFQLNIQIPKVNHQHQEADCHYSCECLPISKERTISFHPLFFFVLHVPSIGQSDTQGARIKGEV